MHGQMEAQPPCRSRVAHGMRQPRCVDRAQFSTDGGDWATKRAANGVLDETSGKVMGMVAALATPGVHEVRVRGIYRYGNPGDSGGQDSGTVIA